MDNYAIRTVYQCNLRTLTPVHVGSGEKLVRNFDFFQQNNKLHVIKSSKMFSVIEKLAADKIMEFARAIEEEDVVTWLQKQGIHLDSIASYSFMFPEPKTPREIHAHIRDAFGSPFIPGSSLKGALRTAIIRKLVQAEDNFQIKPADTNLKFKDQTICRSLLGHDPKENLLRTLTVGDYTFQPDQIRIQKVWVNRLTNKTNFAGKFPPIYIEGINNNASSQGIISFNEFLPDKDNEKGCFKFRTRLTLPWLLDACRSLTRHTIETELQFLKGKTGKSVDGLRTFYSRLSGQVKELSENEVILQIAWGSGWRGMTGQLLESRDLTNELRKKLRLAVKYISFPFPKSRRVTSVNGVDNPMGWVKLSFIPMEEAKRKEQERQQLIAVLENKHRKEEAEKKAAHEHEKQLQLEWEAMTPEERDLACIRKEEVALLYAPNDAKDPIPNIWPHLDAASPEHKKRLALAFKERWQKEGRWNAKKKQKKQWKKVQKIKEILGE